MDDFWDDPIEVPPQGTIESELLRLSALLETRTNDIAVNAQRNAVADVAYKRTHAIALLEVDGRNAEEREARAHQQVLAEYEAKRISEALLVSAQEAARNIRAQLSSLQTLAANQRALVS